MFLKYYLYRNHTGGIYYIYHKNFEYLRLTLRLLLWTVLLAAKHTQLAQQQVVDQYEEQREHDVAQRYGATAEEEQRQQEQEQARQGVAVESRTPQVPHQAHRAGRIQHSMSAAPQRVAPSWYKTAPATGPGA